MRRESTAAPLSVALLPMPDQRNVLNTSVFVAGAVAVAAFFRLGSPTVDRDSFCHFRYGAVYAECGPVLRLR